MEFENKPAYAYNKINSEFDYEVLASIVRHAIHRPTPAIFFSTPPSCAELTPKVFFIKYACNQVT